MRVLHLTPSLEVEKGGVSAAVLGLAESTQRAGVTSTVAFFGDSVSRQSSSVEFLSLGNETGRGSVRSSHKDELKRLISESDIVHIHAVWESIQRVGLGLAVAANRPIVFSPHGMLDRWSMSQKRLKKRVYLELVLRRRLKQVTRFHATCQVEAGMIEAHRFGPSVSVLPLGVSEREFRPLPRSGEFRRRLGLTNSTRPIILFLSRVHPKKGIDILLRAFAQAGLKDKADLIVAGPGDRFYIEELNRLARELQIDEVTTFPGMLYGKHRIEALVDAAMFVLPSHQENFGIAVLEAMATGTPVVVSDQVGLCEEVRSAVAGLVTNVDVERVGQAMSQLAQDMEQRERLGGNGCHAVESQFFWESLAPTWRDFYQSLAKD